MWNIVLFVNNDSAILYSFLSSFRAFTEISYWLSLISSQYLNIGGRQGTTYDVATLLFNHSLSSAALRETPNSIPVHSLMLSSHLFFCLPLLLAPFTVPCRIVFAMPEDLEMWPYHLSFRFFTMVRRSSCTPVEPRHEKTCSCHMRTTKAQISLRIRAVWSAPLLFAA